MCGKLLRFMLLVHAFARCGCASQESKFVRVSNAINVKYLEISRRSSMDLISCDALCSDGCWSLKYEENGSGSKTCDLYNLRDTKNTPLQFVNVANLYKKIGELNVSILSGKYETTGMKEFDYAPMEGIQAEPLNRHCCHWQASITGSRGSPFEGGVFLLYLQIPDSYQLRPPRVQFITKIFHPNISRHGDVVLDYNWFPADTISQLLMSIRSLLNDPDCDVCMEPVIGRLYRNNREEFDRIARLWTWKHAMHDFAMSV